MHTIAVTMRMTPSGTRTPIKIIDVLSIKRQAGKTYYTSLTYMVSSLNMKIHATLRMDTVCSHSLTQAFLSGDFKELTICALKTFSTSAGVPRTVWFFHTGTIVLTGRAQTWTR